MIGSIFWVSEFYEFLLLFSSRPISLTSLNPLLFDPQSSHRGTFCFAVSVFFSLILAFMLKIAVSSGKKNSIRICNEAHEWLPFLKEITCPKCLLNLRGEAIHRQSQNCWESPDSWRERTSTSQPEQKWKSKHSLRDTPLAFLTIKVFLKKY